MKSEPTNSRILSRLHSGTLFAACSLLTLATAAFAQQNSGTPGSPSATTTIDGKYTAPTSPAAAPSGPQPAFSVLPGRWVRPDGGYVISIRGVDAGGRLDASYANPAPLPFHTAEVNKDGDALKVFFELRAGGYNGSTYTLAYDPATDRLKGVYYQAVARQKFDVVFVRVK